MPVDNEKVKEDRRRAWSQALSIGWELASFTVLGFALGYWLDGRFGSSPWGVLGVTLLGIGLGLYRVVRISAGDVGSGRR